MDDIEAHTRAPTRYERRNKFDKFAVPFKRILIFGETISNGVMPAATMFSKFKSGTTAPQNPIDTNPIVQHFEIGKQTAFAGPELVWKIHDAYKKSDGRVSMSLFFLFQSV